MLPLVPIGREELRQLLAKYEEIQRLRVLEESPNPGDPKAAMRHLAERFPGALRELDRLPMSDVEARIAALRRALSGAEAPHWAPAQSLYHRLFRACLSVKRDAALVAAAQRRPTTADDLRGRLGERAGSEFEDPEIASLLPDPHTLLKPAEGRLHPWVISRVAEHLGIRAEDVEAAFHPA